jgi:hypothetical protein
MIGGEGAPNKKVTLFGSKQDNRPQTHPMGERGSYLVWLLSFSLPFLPVVSVLPFPTVVSPFPRVTGSME